MTWTPSPNPLPHPDPMTLSLWLRHFLGRTQSWADPWLGTEEREAICIFFFLPEGPKVGRPAKHLCRQYTELPACLGRNTLSPQWH